MTEDAGGPIDNPTEYTPMAAPGSRLLHVWDASGRSLFDRLGAEFTVLGFNDLGAEALWRVAADEVGLSLEIVLPEEHDLTALCAADWVLVRPDQYTARHGRCVGASRYSLGSGWNGMRDRLCLDRLRSIASGHSANRESLGVAEFRITKNGDETGADLGAAVGHLGIPHHGADV
uniref:hypothetical protein n=1 Tax=Sphingomonas bacterium TaxID=1895847 RepID=UPI00262638CB|nr:hypothetical protein [Sphingomonas bacterium]